MDINELRNLDMQTIGLASLGTRMVIFAFVFVVILGGAIYFFTLPQIDRLERLEREERSLINTIDDKQQLAVNLPQYEAQIEEMEIRFGELLQQLPNKQEAEALIDDVAQTSLAAGLSNRQIQPGNERVHEFYAEMPYTLVIQGTYRQLVNFISDTANLPRIVTLHNPTFKPHGAQDREQPQLTMTIQARTYRYLEDGE
ncbi:MAG TPA: pilus assembly protein PilO [Halothiobacillaceae bacterium]|nr:pilus assembly protein PilO [Halothiobacillaceae bacterium]